MENVMTISHYQKVKDTREKDRKMLVRIANEHLPKEKHEEKKITDLQKSMDLEKWSLVEMIYALYLFQKHIQINRQFLWSLHINTLYQLETNLLKGEKKT
ncbi:hypothetical protein ACYRFS_12900 [Listeria kieliensis]